MDGIGPREIGKALAEQLPPLTPNAAAVEADRCLYCYDAPCTHACPTHIDIPRFIKKIASQQSARLGGDDFCFQSAGRNLRARLPGAGVVRGRVRAGRGPQAHRHWTAAALAMDYAREHHSYPV
jgi:Fe-S oxidoreductase